MSDVDLLFRIKSESKQARADLTGLRSHVAKEVAGIKAAGERDFNAFRKAFDKETAAIKDGAKTLGLKVAQDLGVSAEGAARLAAGARVAAVGIAAVGAGAIAAGVGIFKLVESVSEAVDDLADLAAQTNVNIETLSAFKNLHEEAGGSLQTTTQALVFYQRQMFAANDETSKAGKLFKTFSLDTQDVEKSVRQAFTALFQMGEGIKQTNAASELFGARGGKQVLGLIKETNGDLDAAIERYRAMGKLIGEDAAEAANKFQHELKGLQQTLRGVLTEAAIELMPMITERLTEISEWVRTNREEIKATIVGVGKYLDAAIITPLKFIVGLLQKAVELSQWLKSLAPSDESGGEAYYIPTGILPYDIAAIKPGGGPAPASQKPPGWSDPRKWMASGPPSINIPYGPSGGGGGSAKDDPRIKQLEDEKKEAERVYKEETAALKDEYDRRVINLITYTQEVERLEKELFEKRRAIILQQRALAKPADQGKYDTELTSVGDEKSANIMNAWREAEKELLDFRRDLQEKELDLRAEFDESNIAAIRARIAADASTEVEGLKKIASIREDAFKREEQDLISQREEIRSKAKDQQEAETLQEVQLLDVRLNILRQKWYTEKEEHERIAAEADARELERQQQHQDTLFNLLLQYQENMRAARRRAQSEAEEYERKHKILTNEIRARMIYDRAAADLDEIEANSQRIIRELNTQERLTLAEAKGEKEREAIRAYYRELRAQEQQRKEDEERERIRRADDETKKETGEGGGFFNGIKEELNKIPDVSPIQFAANSVTTAFKNMKGAVLDSINAFIFYGESVGKILKRALAETLASIAKEAAIQGIKQTALALAALAVWDLRGAAMHGASAAAWFAIAGGAALAGRAVMGSMQDKAGEQSTQSALKGAESAQPTGPKEIVMERARDESVIAAESAAARMESAAARMEAAANRLHNVSFGEVVAAGAATGTGQAAIGRAFVHGYSSGGDVREIIRTDGIYGT